MYMSYTTNPHMPKVRKEAVKLVRSGWSIRKTARHFGVYPSTVLRWKRKAKILRSNALIPTLSSRPDYCPHTMSDELVAKVLDYRRRYRRCAQVLHFLLLRDGYQVSLSSVKRTLRRNNCSRFSKWKKWHKYPLRPKAEKPGILVQLDTIWDGISTNRLYVYTLLDVCSRWSYAWPSDRATALRSLGFVKRAQVKAPFDFMTLQSDHGSEFSKWFTKQVGYAGFSHRYSRIRTPTDNGHLERFNRTLQEECLSRSNRSLRAWRKEIPEYLLWYNTQRPHMGLEMKTPLEVLRSY